MRITGEKKRFGGTENGEGEGRTGVIHSCAEVTWQEKLQRGEEMKVGAKQRR